MMPQELKNSILQLAIQGKLVEQRPDEGTGEELYRQIQVEKKRLIKAGKIKQDKPLPEITEDEKPFEIPESWMWVRVGEVMSVNGGKRIPAGRQLVDYDTGHKYIRVTDMKNGSVICTHTKYVPNDIIEAIQAYTISQNDVYITVAGTIGQLGLVPVEFDNANLTENADKIIVYRNSKEFVYNMMSSPLVQRQIYDSVTKVGQPKLAIIKIQTIVIPLPPLAEQQRIVAKIEELLPYIDRYEQAWSKLEDFNKRFPFDMQKSLLQMAIQGKLVEQCPEEGTGEDLYRQIQARKTRLIKAGKIKQDEQLPDVIDDESNKSDIGSKPGKELSTVESITRLELCIIANHEDEFNHAVAEMVQSYPSAEITTLLRYLHRVAACVFRGRMPAQAPVMAEIRQLLWSCGSPVLYQTDKIVSWARSSTRLSDAQRGYIFSIASELEKIIVEHNRQFND